MVSTDNQHCKNHPERRALSSCHVCGQRFCRGCLVEGLEYYYCRNAQCLAHLPQSVESRSGGESARPSMSPEEASAVVKAGVTTPILGTLCILLGLFLGLHPPVAGESTSTAGMVRATAALLLLKGIGMLRKWHKAHLAIGTRGRDEHGRTPLMVACADGDADTAALLVRRGATIDDRDNWGNTALMIACATGQSNTAEILVAMGADVNSRNAQGATPLILACRAQSVASVKALLRAGARVTDEDHGGNTAFKLAISSGNRKIVRLLRPYVAEPQTGMR